MSRRRRESTAARWPKPLRHGARLAKKLGAPAWARKNPTAFWIWSMRPIMVRSHTPFWGNLIYATKAEGLIKKEVE